MEQLLNVYTMGLLVASLVAGIFIGALPGLTATMGVALLVPLTFWLEPLPALLTLMGVYVGAMYGGAIPAILVRAPGTPAAAATTLDGYPLAQQGKAGLAMSVSCIAGVIGGVFSTGVLILGAPTVAKFSLAFGPAEYFALAIFGLSLIASLSERALLKGWLMGALGLLIAMIGLDPITAIPRFTMGRPELLEGAAFVPVLIGLFALGESFYQASIKPKPPASTPGWGRSLPTKEEMKQIVPASLHSSVSGTVIGALPGVGGDIASFVAYDHAKKLSRDKQSFGNGSLEGLAAAECANNAVTGGAMIPLLTLGIPGDSVTAVLVGALMIHNVKPGPELFQKQPELVHALFWGLMIANLLILPIGLLGAKGFAQMIRIPRHYLLPLIVSLCVVGAYAMNNSLFDVGVMMTAGLLGWWLKRYGFPLSPLALGLILGRMTEENLRRALILSEGSPLIFLTRPIALGLLTAALVSVIYAAIRARKSRPPAQESNLTTE